MNLLNRQKWYISYLNIHILNVIIYYKATVFIVVHFSMQNTELSRDLDCALGQGYVSVRLELFFFDLGLTSLSTIFQSYRDGVWMWQGAQCSLLECCLTEISCPRHFDMIFHPVTLY